MLWFVTLAVPMLTLGLLAALHAAWRRFTRWTPVAAPVIATDYPEAERRDDRWRRWAGGWRGWDWRSDEGSRWVEATLAWEDAGGARHRATHGCRVPAGSVEEAARVLWYDPTDPSRSSLAGPGWFLLLACGCAAGLASVLAVARAGA